MAGVGATAAAGATVISAPIGNPDAELLAACAAFDVLEREFHDADPDEWTAFDALGHRIRAEQEPHRDVIINVTATTAAGHAARAQSYLLWMDTTPDALSDSADEGEQMLGALFADLIGDEVAS